MSLDRTPLFDAGFTAYQNGESQDKNPYTDAVQRDNWLCGYLYAEALVTPKTEVVPVMVVVGGES